MISKLKRVGETMRERLKSGTLALILLLSLVTTTGLIFVPPAAAQPAGGVYVDNQLLTDIEAYVLRNALAACVNEAGNTVINAADLVAGNWFSSDSNNHAVTHLVDTQDGKRQCSTTSMVTQTISTVGFPSVTQAACAMGAHRVDGSNCVNGTGDFWTPTSPGTVQGAIDRQRKVNVTPAMYYLIYARSMEIGCRASPVVPVASATADQKTLAGSDNGWEMQVVGADGTITNMIYQSQSGFGRGRDITTSTGPNSHADQSETCIQLVNDANKYAAAYAAYVKQHPGQGSVPSTTPAGTGQKTTCQIDGIGWIVCPVLKFLSKIVDESYSIVSALLSFQPLLTTGETAGIYNAWSYMRTFANVVFVIMFLIIIFSQLTGAGISNYGIKKMLPRLIVAAIIVNASYWICAILVDISNILGSSIGDLFNGLKQNAALNPAKGVSSAATGNGWVGITGGLLAGTLATGAALYVGLSALLPILITVLFAIVAVLITLALRQAAIVLLVIVSPLAFVAYLLPNTQELFKQWRKIFEVLLLLYPAISLLYGASAVASQVVMNSAPGGNEGIKIAVQIMGAGIAVIPLIATPLLLKGAQAALRIGGFTGNLPGQKQLGKAAQGVRERQEGRRATRELSGSNTFGIGKYRRRAKREAITAGVASERNRAQADYVASEALSDKTFRNRLGGGLVAGPNASPAALNRALANAINVQAKIEADEVTAASAVIKNANLDQKQMRELAEGGTVGDLNGSSYAVRAAAMKNVIDNGDNTGVNRLLNSVDEMDAQLGAEMGKKVRTSLADSLKDSSLRPSYVNQGAIADIRQGMHTNEDGSTRSTLSSTELAVNAINNNTYSVEKIATGDKDELDFVRGAASLAPDQAQANFMDNARSATTDPRYSGRIGKNAEVVNKIRDGNFTPSS